MRDAVAYRSWNMSFPKDPRLRGGAKRKFVIAVLVVVLLLFLCLIFFMMPTQAVAEAVVAKH